MDAPPPYWLLTPTQEMFVRVYSAFRRDLERYDRELLSENAPSPERAQIIEEFVRGAVELGNHYLTAHERVGSMARDIYLRINEEFRKMRSANAEGMEDKTYDANKSVLNDVFSFAVQIHSWTERQPPVRANDLLKMTVKLHFLNDNG